MKKDKPITRIKYNKKEVATALLFVLPAFVMWLYWFLYPAVKSMRLSFYEYSYINPDKTKFVGLNNFIRLFQDSEFLKALSHSFIMVAVVVGLLTLLSFTIAVMLQGNIRGKTFFRTSYYMPYVISSVAVSIFFMYFFLKDGPGTMLFTLIGFKNTTWFTSKKYALILVILIYVWQQIGFYMILYISGLQNISGELYEAAKIDGANKMQSIRYLTIPLVKQTTYLVVTLGMINSFQIFDQIAAISKQSPLGSPAGSTSTIVTYLYQQSFSYMDMGYGSAAAMVLFMIIFILSLVRMFITREES
ncbi:MAG: sugar ABC transporter permease [Anaerocolumna sp.]